MQLEEDGTRVPILEEEPEIFPDLIPIWNAFMILSRSRQSGFGIGYIPYQEIIAYLNENDIFEKIYRDEWIRWIQYLDHEYLKIQSKDLKNG